MTLQQIADIVCEHTGMSFEQITFRTRKREIVKVRQIMIYLMTRFSKCSLNEIGAFICPKKPLDHSTVIHSRDKAKMMIETNDEDVTKYMVYFLPKMFLDSNGEQTIRDIVCGIVNLLDIIPHYTIPECKTLGELSDYLSGRKKKIIFVEPEKEEPKKIDRESFTRYSNKQHVA